MALPVKKNRKQATEELELIEQFFVTLNATFQQVKATNPSSNNEILEKIEELLKLTSWQNAYEIERLLVEIYDDKTLDVEVNRRLVDAKANLSENISSHYDNQIAAATEESTKRSILNRMINDLQWNYAIKEARRKYSRVVSIKNGWAFIISLVIFVLIFVLGKSYILNGKLPYLVIALSAGLVGASFSMVVTSKSRLAASSFDELKGLHRTIYVVTRSLIGLGATLILYFMLQAGLLTGSVFPKFSEVTQKQELINLALLISWSIVAGFSEKFVPNLLAKAEEKATIKSA